MLKKRTEERDGKVYRVRECRCCKYRMMTEEKPYAEPFRQGQRNYYKKI